MNILVVGRGGREHTIVWALSKSSKVDKLFCAPGNGGIAELAECVPISEQEYDRLADFAEEHRIDLVIIGPDDPLSDGIVDHLESRQLKVYGPRKQAAIIEGSKVFTKNLLKKYNIPTAAYESFEQYEDALAYLQRQSLPIVIKADGLAAGKGVIIAQTMAEAEQALRDIMVDKVFGNSGDRVVIEEFLQGQEMSILSFVDGETVRPMLPAQDHKQIYDGDQGPNTGGMGTYSPVPHIPQNQIDRAIEEIIRPTARAMVQEGRPFRGVLFAGLMMTADGPKTIEFNARFGDPEAQVVLPLLETDLLDIILASMEGTLDQVEIKWSDRAAVCVILASGGYPGSYAKGLPIGGTGEAPRRAGYEADTAIVFHAGTSLRDGVLVTNGGRVLGVTGIGQNIASAREIAYKVADQITFEGKYHRTDIAQKALV